MNKEKREGAFIPCGDSWEKMREICDNELENVSGGNIIYETPLPGWLEGKTPAGAIEED